MGVCPQLVLMRFAWGLILGKSRAASEAIANAAEKEQQPVKSAGERVAQEDERLSTEVVRILVNWSLENIKLAGVQAELSSSLGLHKG